MLPSLGIFKAVAGVITANGAKVKLAKFVTDEIIEKAEGKAHPMILDSIAKEVNKKMESPWYLSKRFGAIILNALILILNDHYQMGISVEALQSVTAGFIAYILGKSYEQSKT